LRLWSFRGRLLPAGDQHAFAAGDMLDVHVVISWIGFTACRASAAAPQARTTPVNDGLLHSLPLHRLARQQRPVLAVTDGRSQPTAAVFPPLAIRHVDGGVSTT
jgi:hypothetical protein